MHRTGTLLCLASAVAFSTMVIFAKLAYAEGASVGTTLAVRFVIASVLFAAVLAVARKAAEFRLLARRDLIAALALGACGYGIPAGLFFVALERLDASLASLLVYTFPAIVAIAAVALGREHLDRRRLLALVLASSGLVLVIGGAGAGALDPLGVALALAAALSYAAFILASEDISERIPSQIFSALICTGAAFLLTVGAALFGQLSLSGLTTAGWGWIVCLAVISTVVSISCFIAGMERIGATRAAILTTIEPVVTVVLAFVFFGEALGLVQFFGGALVLAVVPVLNARLDRFGGNRATVSGFSGAVRRRPGSFPFRRARVRARSSP